MKYIFLFLPLLCACQKAAPQPEISGHVLWEHDLSALPNTVVNIIGDDSTYQRTADADGYWSCEVGPGSYMVIPYLRCDPMNGIDTSDADRIQQHLVGNPLPTKWKIFASDVNRNLNTTSFDCYIVQAACLGNEQARQIIGGWWTFCPANFNPPMFDGYAVPNYPEGREVVVSEDNVPGVDFVGFRRGDVNGSAKKF